MSRFSGILRPHLRGSTNFDYRSGDTPAHRRASSSRISNPAPAFLRSNFHDINQRQPALFLLSFSLLSLSSPTCTGNNQCPLSKAKQRTKAGVKGTIFPSIIVRGVAVRVTLPCPIDETKRVPLPRLRPWTLSGTLQHQLSTPRSLPFFLLPEILRHSDSIHALRRLSFSQDESSDPRYRYPFSSRDPTTLRFDLRSLKVLVLTANQPFWFPSL